MLCNFILVLIASCVCSSNLLRLALSNGYQLHSWFTYSMLLLFLSTAGFWVKLSKTISFCFACNMFYFTTQGAGDFTKHLVILTSYFHRWRGWMKDWHCLMPSKLFPCFRLLGLSSLFVQDLYTFRSIRSFLSFLSFL